MAGQDLTLALRIKALVEGLDQVKAIADGIAKVDEQSHQPMGDPTPPLREGISHTTDLVKEAQKAFVEFFGLTKIKDFVDSAIENFNKAERGFRGLEAAANSSGVDVGAAMKVAANLAGDGLVKLADAQRALQNLLSRGYDLSQAEQVLEAIKNVASVARAQGLSIGDAVLAASEGIKKQRSLQLEESGVIVKLGDAWKGYGDQVDSTASSLSDSEKIQAEANAILQFSASYTGKAEEAAKSLEGQMAKSAAETAALSGGIGQKLAPSLTFLIDVWHDVEAHVFVPFIDTLQIVGAAVAAVAIDIKNLFAAALSRDFSKFGDQLKANAQQFNDTFDAIVNQPTAPTFAPGAKPGPKPPAPPVDAYAKFLKDNADEFKKSVDEQIKDAQRLSEALIKAFDASLAAQKRYGEAAKQLRLEAAQKPKDSSVEGQASATLDLITAEQKLQSIKASAPLEDVQRQVEQVQELAKNLTDQARAQEAINRAKLAEADALDRAAAGEKTQQAGITEQQKQNDERISKLQSILQELQGDKTVKIDADTAQASTALQQIKVMWDAIQSKTVTLNVQRGGAPLSVDAVPVPGHATGTLLPGYGGGDQIPALLEAGESITRKEAVAYYGPSFMRALNAMQLPRFAAGGIVSGMADAVSSGGKGLHPVTLVMPDGGSWPMSATPDVVAGLQGAIAAEALKRGRRR